MVGYILCYIIYSIIFFFFPIANNNIIEIPFNHFMSNYLLRINFGTPNQLIEEAIDQTKNHSLFIFSQYKPEYSSTWSNYSSSFLNNWAKNRCLVNHYSDDITFPDLNITIPDYNFLFLNVISRFYSPPVGFGFGYKFIDEQYSLIHQLYNHKVISKRSYSFNSTHQSIGKLFLGGVPEEVTSQYHKMECVVDSIDDNWGCLLTKVSIGNNYTYTYINKHPSYFQVSSDNLLAPDDFFDYLNETILKPFFDKGHCIKGYENEEIKCREHLFEQIGKICFEFSRKALCYDASYLFDMFGPYKKFLISRNRGQNVWKFGNLLLKRFITTFDYDKNSITFYSKQPFSKIVDLRPSKFEIWFKSKSVSCSISFIAGVILCLGMLYVYRLISLKRKKKKLRLLNRVNKEILNQCNYNK